MSCVFALSVVGSCVTSQHLIHWLKWKRHPYFLARIRHTFPKLILCHDQVFKRTKAKVYVYSGWVLCQGKMEGHSEANKKLRDQICEFQRLNEYAELYGFDGEPIIEFEWNNFRGLISIQFLRHAQQDLNVWRKNAEQFEGIILFMSIDQARKICDQGQGFRDGIGFFVFGDEAKWYGTCNCNPERNWDQHTDQMIDVFA